MPPEVRKRVAGYAAAILLAGVVGFVLIVASDNSVADIVGIVLLGGALVIAVAAVFAEVGFSEDRERQAEDADRRRRSNGRP